MKIKYIIFALLFFNQIAFSQKEQKENSSSNIIFRTSFGYSQLLNSFPKIGYITDNLTDTDKNNFQFDFSMAWLFCNWKNNSFGIEFPTYNNNSFIVKANKQKFISSVENKYSDDYFVRTTEEYGLGVNDDMKLSGGPIYRYKKDNVFFIGRLLIGIIYIGVDRASVELKKKETNDIFNMTLHLDDYPNNFKHEVYGVCYYPSITFGYRMGVIAFSFDINYWLSDIDFEYTEKIENAVTHDIQTTKYKYKKLLNEISFGVGIMVLF